MVHRIRIGVVVSLESMFTKNLCYHYLQFIEWVQLSGSAEDAAVFAADQGHNILARSPDDLSIRKFEVDSIYFPTHSEAMYQNEISHFVSECFVKKIGLGVYCLDDGRRQSKSAFLNLINRLLTSAVWTHGAKFLKLSIVNLKEAQIMDMLQTPGQHKEIESIQNATSTKVGQILLFFLLDKISLMEKKKAKMHSSSMLVTEYSRS
jgi:hypothetical protein